MLIMHNNYYAYTITIIIILCVCILQRGVPLVDVDVSDSEGEEKAVEPEQQWRKSQVHTIVIWGALIRINEYNA